MLAQARSAVIGPRAALVCARGRMATESYSRGRSRRGWLAALPPPGSSEKAKRMERRDAARTAAHLIGEAIRRSLETTRVSHDRAAIRRAARDAPSFSWWAPGVWRVEPSAATR